VEKSTITTSFIAIAVMLSGVPVPVFGTPPFGNSPDWESADERATREIALADFNGDGWQMVTGETKTGDGHAKVFYIDHFPALTINGVNVDGTPVPRSDYCFDARTGWFSLKNSPADGAAVEVDYVWSNKLDLFATNHPRDESDGREVIYFNTGDGLNPEPGWVSGVDDDNWACEAADFDNDGDVDVAVGGWDAIKIYENNGSGLETLPSWVCDASAIPVYMDIPGYVNSLAWGDLNNDGYLELAAAAISPPDSWFYVFKNNGGVLEDTPSWIIDDYEWPIKVAWGDIDADGDMDLAGCTTFNTDVDYGDGFAYVFKNDGGTLETSPCWTNNEPRGKCGTLAWGDVNGDGELDLVKGISGWSSPPCDKYTDIYYSENWFLTRDPSWESACYVIELLAFLADCDSDGKLDLVSAYLNARGYFTYSDKLEVYPSLEYNLYRSADLRVGSYFTYSDEYPSLGYLYLVYVYGLYVGDINGDGTFDIALGCDSDLYEPTGTPNLVFYNTRNTVSR
jgi:hypothetical protein